MNGFKRITVSVFALLVLQTAPARAANHFVSDFTEFIAALSSYAAGDTIYFENDIAATSTAVTQAGLKVTIDASGYAYTYADPTAGTFKALNAPDALFEKLERVGIL